MKKLIGAILVSISLSACVAGGGATVNGGAALSAAQKSAFVGSWSGNLPSGKAVRVVVSPEGGVSYSFQGQSQTLTNVKLTSTRLSATVGTNGSTITLGVNGAYAFTWGPTGEVTRATLRKG